MNILTDQLPDSIEIDGVEYLIDTNFRNCLRIILAFEDNSLTRQEKFIVLLRNLYLEPPHDLNKAIEKANWFLDGGKNSSDGEGGRSYRLFSFAKDANLIYAAFKQTHDIDLNTADLHWWAFIALFMDLGQDTTFCQLAALRKRLATDRASKDDRELAREMQDIVDLPDVDNRTLEEKDMAEEFMRLVRQGQTMKKGG